MSEEKEGGKRNLGKGLSALLGDEGEDYAELDRVRLTKMVPIEFVHPGKFQPRRHFDEEEIDGLVESIGRQGVLQPILVRRHPEKPIAYEIIAGERRWRAAQRAKLHEIPVIIKDLGDAAVVSEQYDLGGKPSAAKPHPDRRGRRLSAPDRRIFLYPGRAGAVSGQEPQPRGQHAASYRSARRG